MEQDNIAQNKNYHVHLTCYYDKMVDIATKKLRSTNSSIVYLSETGCLFCDCWGGLKLN